MNKTNEFKKKLEEMIGKLPIINYRYKNKQALSLNELTYVLRMAGEYDYAVSTNDGGCIPSVRETFIPSSWLAKNINLETIEYLEEEFEGEISRNVCIDFIK